MSGGGQARLTMILAPLRGVTIRSFRRVFAAPMAEAGLTESVQPFVPAMKGLDPLKDRELAGGPGGECATPQFIGKDPAALRECLKRVKDAGWEFADLNCGCPFPMIRKKGRGSGILRTPDVLARMLEAGCDEMGPGKFSAKTRLGLDTPDEFPALAGIFNAFPLRRVTVHARTARQMYEGECDIASFRAAASALRVPVVYNGDASLDGLAPGGVAFGELGCSDVMVGRSFIRSLAVRPDIKPLLSLYIEESLAELGSERPVLGRIKELVAYWRGRPEWSRRWGVVKIARSLRELRMALQLS